MAGQLFREKGKIQGARGRRKKHGEAWVLALGGWKLPRGKRNPGFHPVSSCWLFQEDVSADWREGMALRDFPSQYASAFGTYYVFFFFLSHQDLAALQTPVSVQLMGLRATALGREEVGDKLLQMTHEQADPHNKWSEPNRFSSSLHSVPWGFVAERLIYLGWSSCWVPTQAQEVTLANGISRKCWEPLCCCHSLFRGKEEGFSIIFKVNVQELYTPC